MANLVERDQPLPDLFESSDFVDTGDDYAEEKAKGFFLMNTETWPRVIERIARWDDSPLRSELLTHSEPPDNWRELQADSIAQGNFPPEYFRDGLRLAKVLRHYRKIEVARFLRVLVQTEPENTLDEFETLVSTLRYAELPYLRQCAKEDCGKIFYAGRSLQPGCTPSHSSAIRKKRKRDTDRLNQQHKRSGKNKRAQTSGKRSKRP